MSRFPPPSAWLGEPYVPYRVQWIRGPVDYSVYLVGPFWRMPPELLDGMRRFGLALPLDVLADIATPVLAHARRHGRASRRFEAAPREWEDSVPVLLEAVHRCRKLTFGARWRAHGCKYGIRGELPAGTTERAIGYTAGVVGAALRASVDLTATRLAEDLIWVHGDELLDTVRCDGTERPLAIQRGVVPGPII